MGDFGVMDLDVFVDGKSPAGEAGGIGAVDGAVIDDDHWGAMVDEFLDGVGGPGGGSGGVIDVDAVEVGGAIGEEIVARHVGEADEEIAWLRVGEDGIADRGEGEGLAF